MKMNFNMQMSYTLIEYMPKIHPNWLNSFIYSYHNKLYNVKVYIKVTFFVLQISFEMNLNMHVSSIELVCKTMEVYCIILKYFIIVLWLFI